MLLLSIPNTQHADAISQRSTLTVRMPPRYLPIRLFRRHRPLSRHFQRKPHQHCFQPPQEECHLRWKGLPCAQARVFGHHGGDLSAPEWDCLGADIQPCIGCGAQVCNVRTVETDYSWMIYWENVGSFCLAGHCPFSMGRLSIIWDNCLRLGRAPVRVLTTSPEVAERSAWD